MQSTCELLNIIEDITYIGIVITNSELCHVATSRSYSDYNWYHTSILDQESMAMHLETVLIHAIWTLIRQGH